MRFFVDGHATTERSNSVGGRSGCNPTGRIPAHRTNPRYSDTSLVVVTATRRLFLGVWSRCRYGTGIRVSYKLNAIHFLSTSTINGVINATTGDRAAA